MRLMTTGRLNPAAPTDSALYTSAIPPRPRGSRSLYLPKMSDSSAIPDVFSSPGYHGVGHGASAAEGITPRAGRGFHSCGKAT